MRKPLFFLAVALIYSLIYLRAQDKGFNTYPKYGENIRAVSKVYNDTPRFRADSIGPWIMSGPEPLPQLFINGESISGYNYRPVFDTSFRPDTARIIYIGFDTSYQKFTGSNSLRKADGYIVQYTGADPHRIPWVIWQFGYLVSSWGRPNTFLTYKKRPISSTFFVFDYRIIEPKKRAF